MVRGIKNLNYGLKEKMVPIKDRVDYLEEINKSPKLIAFNNLLSRKAFNLFPKKDFNESEEIYFGLVNAIYSNDKKLFENYYNRKNKSHPSKDSPLPFVNDDFLIFCLKFGVTKFDLDKSWIKYIVSLRNRNNITITFENILNENYYSNTNFFEVVLMYFHINNPSLITNALLNNAYKSIIENTALFDNKNDFQILCAIKANDLIIELKTAPEMSEINLLRNFNSKFVKRIKLLTWIVQTAILVILFYLIIELIAIKPTIKTFFDNLGSALKILGLVGLSQLGNIIPFFKKNLYKIILRIFGYPKELIKELIVKEGK